MTLLSVRDRVEEYARDVGVADVTLLGATSDDLVTFAAAGLNGLTVPYMIRHRVLPLWEVGYGVIVSSTTLTRVIVLSNSSGTTAKINFLAGTVDVVNTLPAAKAVLLDADTNALHLPGALDVVGALTAATVAGAGSGITALNMDNAGSGTLAGARGGTGVSNSGKTITLAGNLATIGAFALAFTLTAGTGVTLPTSGTLATVAYVDTKVGSVTGTTNRITIGGSGTAPTVDIAATYVGQASITTVGALASGSLANGFGNIAIGASTISGGAASFATGTFTTNNNDGVLVSGAGAASYNVTTSDGNAKVGYYMGGVANAGMDRTANSGEIRIGGFSTGDVFPVIYSDGVAALTFGLGATPSATFVGAVSGASFTGPLTGNVTGNVSGTAATVTSATQTAITTLSNLVTVGTITSGAWTATPVVTTYGGTGLASYTAGDLLYYASGTTLAKLAIASANNILVVAGGVPGWAASLAFAALPQGGSGSWDAGAGNTITVTRNLTVSGTLTATLTGLAATATALATGRTIGMTGDLTWTTGAFDGTANVTAAGTLATVNGNVGSFGSSTAIPVFTVNGKGLITAASTAAVVAPADTLTGTTLAANVVTSSLAALGTVTTGAWNGTVIITTYGGTGLSAYTAGDLPYYAAGTALSKLGIGAADRVLTSSGTAPQWSANLAYGVLPTGSGAWDTGAATTITVTRSLTVSGTLTATLTGDATGNAGTVTNGVYTTGSYADPAWITSLAGSKISSAVATATLAAQATILQTARNLWGVSFNGGADATGAPTFGAGATVSNGQTLALGTATVSGTPTWASTQTVNITGNVTGNVTGNASGTAATVTNATQAAITTLANVVTVGTITSGVWNGTAVVTTYGGTGLTAYTAGDLPYYASGTALSKLAIGAADRILTSSGTAPQWSANLAYATLPTGTGAWDTGAATTITITRSLTVSGTLTGTLTGNVSGSAATVTSASQTAITTLSNLVTTGALDSGSITSGFGAINIGADAITAGAGNFSTVVTNTTTDAYGFVLTGSGASSYMVKSSDNAQIRGYYIGGTTSANNAGIDANPNSGEVRIGGFSTGDYYAVIYSDGVASLSFGNGGAPAATFVGAVTVGGTFKYGVAAAAAVAVASTHKIAVQDNTGATFYLLATNV